MLGTEAVLRFFVIQSPIASHKLCNTQSIFLQKTADHAPFSSFVAVNVTSCGLKRRVNIDWHLQIFRLLPVARGAAVRFTNQLLYQEKYVITSSKCNGSFKQCITVLYQLIVRKTWTSLRHQGSGGLFLRGLMHPHPRIV
jgi:hypothetical protein